MLLFITIIASSVRHKCGSSVVEYTIFVIMAHHTTNSHMAGGITKTVCLAQCVMMMAGSSSLVNDPV